MPRTFSTDDIHPPLSYPEDGSSPPRNDLSQTHYATLRPATGPTVPVRDPFPELSSIEERPENYLKL